MLFSLSYLILVKWVHCIMPLLLAVQIPLYYDINILKQSYSPLICLLLHYMVTVVGIEPTLLHIFIITPTLPVSFRVQSSTGFEPPYHSIKWVSIKPKQMLLNPWSVCNINICLLYLSATLGHKTSDTAEVPVCNMCAVTPKGAKGLI